ncbi:MAG: tetratricopeptide repeat protein [Blastocatellia bacterium]|nr:tetratricopeptide repeat protein [Blastocatellia bacterium]
MAKQGLYEEAREHYMRAARLDPRKADEAYHNLGLIYRSEGQLVEALRFFWKGNCDRPRL